MEALVDNGMEQYEPLLNLRDWLVENRDDPQYRQLRLRNGGDGKGPYNIETRAFLLKELLKAQKSSGERLLSSQELKAIQVIWQMDGFAKNAYEIYYQVYENQNEYNMNQKDEMKQRQTTQLAEICARHGVNADKMLNLVKNEKDKRLMRKRSNMQKLIENVIAEEVQSA
jgi:DNA sulfur modification protein DndC